ncbi:MAG: LD-carboxypeptidase [Paludibacteraceae bacterium]|nr:LD-carboxypeptidase [Paludibacteraceae bacterium]
MKSIVNIRIVSPSGVIDSAYIDEAVTRLRAWGYIVNAGAHAREEWGRFAGRDEDRLADIVDALNDLSVDAILCSRGGYGLQRIIDRVPTITKPIIGFSDITALHQKAAIDGCATLHSIMCKHIASLPEESEPLIALRKVLAGKALKYTWDSHPLNRQGKAEGILVGGNLSVLYGLQGTPLGLQQAIKNLKNPILLIEDVCEKHYHIDRMMRNLRMSGVLANLSGLVVGQFSDCEDDELMNSSIYETIKEAVADYDYPILFNAPIGHVEHNLPLWLNRQTTIRSGSLGGQSCIIQH